MVEIILIRHGETEWNIEKMFRGRKDVGLSETGVQQVRLLGKFLSSIELDAIYSSPLKRALETAEAISDNQREEVKLIDRPCLIDMSFGVWEGKSLEEVEEKYSELYETWLGAPHKLRVPEGESLEEVRSRALKVVDTVIGKFKGKVALVSHRVVIKVLTCALLGLSNSHFWNMRIDLGGITSFQHEGGRFILLKHNDTSYQQECARRVSSDF
jgi:broad specificity phosphatase PhoE